MSGRAMLGAAVLGGLACSERPSPGGGATSGADTSLRPADSLVARGGDGSEIWFTLARPDSGGGRRCTDRTIEIRRGGARIPVPLLYTGAAPEVVDDITIRATLSDHCRTGDAYLVDLRTGRPSREPR